ncbi:hypothetical protein V6N11_041182 [Hibiscus sabdariffa]|uniref:Uncharacterized protein n=1 Tax=Hibiscus sabdariffa TaxID=183260 RepID=A0ABR2RK33_9ROSI
MSPCCSHYNLLGHSDRLCLVQVEQEVVKGPEWRVKGGTSKRLNVASPSCLAMDSADAFVDRVELTYDIEVIGNAVISVDEVIGDVVDSASEALSVKVATTTSNGISPSVFVGEVVVSAGDATIADFPPLQSLVVRQKGRGRGNGKVINVKNKFKVVVGAEYEVIEDTRKPRPASLGVANLLQELKAKKVEKFKDMVPEAVDVRGNVLPITSQ